jgi:hypothetical protein
MRLAQRVRIHYPTAMYLPLAPVTVLPKRSFCLPNDFPHVQSGMPVPDRPIRDPAAAQKKELKVGRAH